MIGARGVLVVPLVILWAGVSAVRADSAQDTKGASYFTVRCSGIVYGKTIRIPDVQAAPKKVDVTAFLSLDCKIDIRDPNRVLGTQLQGVITQVTSGRGREIDIPPGPPTPEGSYARPSYQARLLKPPGPDTPFRPDWVAELQPNKANLVCHGSWLTQSGGELQRVKGYFGALVAESIEQVDVPLATSGSWVALTRGREVRLEGLSESDSGYDFSVEIRPQEVASRFCFSIGDPLPDWLIAGLQVVSADGKATPCLERGLLPAEIYTRIAGHVPPGGIKAIRFVIGVHPTRCRVPFELQHVPLPNSNQPAPHRQESR